MFRERTHASSKCAVAVVAASTVIIAACAAPATTRVIEVTKEVVVTAAPGAGAIDPNAKFQLTYLNICFPSSMAVTDLMLAAFGAKYPNVDVKVDCAQGDYAEGVFAQAAAGNLPDVIFSADLFTVPFVNAGVLLDLEQFDKADDSFSFDDIYPNILALGQVPGKPGTYMIPASWDSVQMYYNKDLFEKSGAPVPTDEWTWDDLIAACKIVQEKNPGVYCVANGGTEGWDWWAYFIPWIVGHGGYPVSEDFKTSTFSSPESLAGIQAYVDLWTKHKVTIPIGEQLPSGRDGCFIAGKCATYFMIPGLMKTFREKITDFTWDVVQMPALPKKRVTGMGTYGYGISKDSKNPQAAWELIKFLASPTGQRLSLTNYIGVPFLKSMANDPVYERLQPPPQNIQAFLKGGEIGIFPPNGYPPKCGSLYAGLINQTIRTALEESIRGVKTVEQAFKDADAEIQSCLDTAQ
ncbi:MAG: sugar ABC transporter substrate-binding protein [Anaerolineae bacterium]|nr:sugar ABC transporter substrate-binding protein [Candidatus Roseilinea sp.]MDW8451282.1 sugar ABC transporter substrate-binding protein [Anaerolineae bacterium]